MFLSRSFLAVVVKFFTWLLNRRYSMNFCPDLVSKYRCQALCFFFMFLITFSSYTDWCVFLLPLLFYLFLRYVFIFSVIKDLREEVPHGVRICRCRKVLHLCLDKVTHPGLIALVVVEFGLDLVLVSWLNI